MATSSLGLTSSGLLQALQQPNGGSALSADGTKIARKKLQGGTNSTDTAALEPRTGASPLDKLFSVVDSDSDGSVSKTELSSFLDTLRSRSDLLQVQEQSQQTQTALGQRHPDVGRHRRRRRAQPGGVQGRSRRPGPGRCRRIQRQRGYRSTTPASTPTRTAWCRRTSLPRVVSKVAPSVCLCPSASAHVRRPSSSTSPRRPARPDLTQAIVGLDSVPSMIPNLTPYKLLASPTSSER